MHFRYHFSGILPITPQRGSYASLRTTRSNQFRRLPDDPWRACRSSHRPRLPHHRLSGGSSILVRQTASPTLVSNTPGAATLDFGAGLNKYNRTPLLGTQSFQLTAKPGYRITGFTYSSQLSGLLQDSEAPAGYSGQPGRATSIATAYLAVRGTDGKQLSLVGAREENINGNRLLSFDTGLLNLPDTVNLSLEGNLFLQLGYGYYYNEFGDERKVPSSGWLGAENSLLTIHTAALPVPEPSTWMMLLGGLLLPWAVSRRQARARAA